MVPGKGCGRVGAGKRHGTGLVMGELGGVGGQSYLDGGGLDVGLVEELS